MKSAVRNYASYREGDHAWALGRFIAPISRLEEVERAAQPFFRRRGPLALEHSVQSGTGGRPKDS